MNSSNTEGYLHPVREYVHCCTGVVNIGEICRREAGALLVGVPGIRDGGALKDDVEHSAAVGYEKEGHHRPLGINVAFPVLRDSNEHERDRELDGQDRCAVEDLEEEEVHQAECLVTFVFRFLKVLGVHADAVDGSKNATDCEDGEGDLGPRRQLRTREWMSPPAPSLTVAKVMTQSSLAHVFPWRTQSRRA